MATYTPAIGGTNGRPKKIAGTSAGAADTVYTNGGGTEEVFITAWNTDTSERKLTLLLGGTTNPDDYLPIYLPPEGGPIAILEGHRFDGSVLIKAFADVANKVNVIVDINQIA